MTPILYKNKLVLFLMPMFLVACNNMAFRREPVGKVNDRFLAYYGNDVNKAKAKHKAIRGSIDYSDTVSIEQTAYGRILKREADFLEYNAQNKPYVTLENSGGKVEYLSSNYGAYIKPDTTFDDITIPNGDFEYYYIGHKDYNEVKNIELQESYDYIYVINKEILKQTEIIKLREQEALRQTAEPQESFLDKTKKGLQNLTDRVKNLLK